MCDFYGYTFTDIRKHIERRHADIKTLVCDKCGSAFKSEALLRVGITSVNLSWNTAKVGVKHKSISQSTSGSDTNLIKIWCLWFSETCLNWTYMSATVVFVIDRCLDNTG